MVIVILGILAATALPRFINLQDEASAAATAGVAGALGAASAINRAGALAGDNTAIAVDNCTDIAGALEGGLPAGYTIADEGISAAGVVVTCDLEGPNDTDATFQGIGVAVPAAPVTP
jgi:MSHA pilin protein MshA